MTGTVLRLRSDAYYVPVPNGVWIRTTDGSFTLSGGTVATWVEKLAPLLDRGVVPAELLGALKPEQAVFVDRLLTALEQRKVLRRENAGEVGDDPRLEEFFPQQMEFLRHFAADPGAGLARARRHPLAVAGPGGRADVLTTTLMESGFGDLALLDAEPGAETRELAEDFARGGVPVRLAGPATGATAGAGGRTLIGVFGPGEESAAGEFLDRADALGQGAWAGLVRGQAMLLKGQSPGSGSACVRCAWRRLAHRAAALPPSDGLGHVPVSMAASVLAQELFRYVAVGDTGVLGEGVVVDLTRLSVWRTAVDPDPGCPGHSTHIASASAPAPARGGSGFPESVFGARCFGPLFSCAPEELPQFPLTALRVRLNPPGRSGPTGSADGPVVVAESMAEARAEAALTAVEETVPVPPGTIAGVGRDPGEALARALLRWADTALAPADAATDLVTGLKTADLAARAAGTAGVVTTAGTRRPAPTDRAAADAAPGASGTPDTATAALTAANPTTQPAPTNRATGDTSATDTGPATPADAAGAPDPATPAHTGADPSVADPATPDTTHPAPTNRATADTSATDTVPAPTPTTDAAGTSNPATPAHTGAAPSVADPATPDTTHPAPTNRATADTSATDTTPAPTNRPADDATAGNSSATDTGPKPTAHTAAHPSATDPATPDTRPAPTNQVTADTSATDTVPAPTPAPTAEAAGAPDPATPAHTAAHPSATDPATPDTRPAPTNRTTADTSATDTAPAPDPGTADAPCATDPTGAAGTAGTTDSTSATGTAGTRPGVPYTGRRDGSVRSERARGLARLADADPVVRTERHPAGVWRTLVGAPGGTVVRTGLDADQAEERALAAALALGQLDAADPGTGVVPVLTGTFPPEERTAAVAAALGLTVRTIELPPLVAADLVGVVLAPGPTA
ncbi:hypothetical protein [Streptomyces yaizuensis]|uniref:YcaO domain-containing protein n=1 Tax=Streptomyces yaizuensis TaxID=2989713 RepID=A0ABQ5P2H9_9ACTN|nr:hypothetical protein [Streptomyces sp. YSPA8]GLF96712.1 hypothetical protein SYYSPA8_20465 [Streptomyces sp. YSPA8]